MRKGKMIAQGAHASMKVFLDRMEYCDNGSMKINDITPEMESWLGGQFTKVCVGVKTEEQLLDLYNTAQVSGLPCALIIDAGKTEFHGEETSTCIAIGPAKSEEIDKITGLLKLL